MLVEDCVQPLASFHSVRRLKPSYAQLECGAARQEASIGIFSKWYETVGDAFERIKVQTPRAHLTP